MKKKPTMYSIIVMLLLLPPLLLLVLGITSVLLREPICKGQFLGFTRPFVVTFWPPGDLFEPILTEDVDLMALDMVQEFTFEVKYVGKYAIYIMFDKVVSQSFYETINNTKMKIALEFYEGDVLLLSGVPDLPSAKTGKAGLVRFNDFAVPEVIPCGKNIILKARLIQIDELLEQYGGYKIIIKQLDTGLGSI